MPKHICKNERHKASVETERSVAFSMMFITLKTRHNVAPKVVHILMTA